ncbi:hypothetical protein [Tannerella forsythia]|uniref:hypothetical protein n=1 Tax=Tannerella forsythia TaxID=28112 RepID=UPI0011CF3243|nr:hypothetical protein [Tannerella forsythia]
MQQYPSKSIVWKIVLPLVNDSITFGKDGLFYFHNEGKIGIFPRHTTAQYDEIKQHPRSFYHIVRDGRKGWLDIRTNREYFEDLSQKHRIIRKQKNIVGKSASDSAGETKSPDVKSG